ncbi:MAG: tryptophan synthase subunit alpha [Deltaproteobacteria bacterium]|nr:MAG: tryptophan synthase subunit alpha [Deltaproteobacteria bacterium]
MDRYARMFERLALQRQGAFIPFVMVGDPDIPTSLDIMRALIRGGADALELGLPFSDPVADGPVIQAAAVRTLAGGVRISDCLEALRTLREEHPDVPFGLLTYANLVFHDGIASFYQRVARAGVDSVLVADVPVREAGPFATAAAQEGVAPVLIATPNADAERLAAVAAASRGYVYVVSRSGVTGAEETVRHEPEAVFRQLREMNAAPGVLGFGISTPAQVRAALAMGAAGAISGSAIVRRIADGLGDVPALLGDLETFVREMKAATAPEYDVA